MSVIESSVRWAVDGRRASQRGPVAAPRRIGAPVGKPKAGPTSPLVATAPAQSEELPLSEWGMRVMVVLLLGLFVAAIVVIVVGFLQVSDAPLSAAAATAVVPVVGLA